MCVCARACAPVREVGVAPTPPCQLILDGFLNLKKEQKKKCSQGVCCIPLHEHKQTDQKAILEGEVGGGAGWRGGGVEAEKAP